MPITSGNSKSLSSTRRPVLPQGSMLNSRMLTISTRIMKLVPHRGWKRRWRRTFSTVSSSWLS